MFTVNMIHKSRQFVGKKRAINEKVSFVCWSQLWSHQIETGGGYICSSLNQDNQDIPVYHA